MRTSHKTRKPFPEITFHIYKKQIDLYIFQNSFQMNNSTYREKIMNNLT